MVFMACKDNNELVIPFSNSEIEFSGRIDFSQEEAAEIYWSGSSIKIYFEGESIQALLKDASGDNYYIFHFKPKTKKPASEATVIRSNPAGYSVTPVAVTIDVSVIVH